MAESFSRNEYLVSSFDAKPLGLKDPVKPWLFDIEFHPNNESALNVVSGLWKGWPQANHLRGYYKKASTHGRGFGKQTVPFFGINHYYPGKPVVTQEFTIECVEHENLVMMNLVERWMNLITNVDNSHGDRNSSMFSSAETIYDLSCIVDIRNRGFNGKYLSRHTTYTSAWPIEISAGTMADMDQEKAPTKAIKFACLLALASKK